LKVLQLTVRKSC